MAISSTENSNFDKDSLLSLKSLNNFSFFKLLKIALRNEMNK